MWTSLLLFITAIIASGTPENGTRKSELTDNTISIRLNFNPNQLKDSGHIEFRPVGSIGRKKANSELKRPKNGMIEWTIRTDEPGYISVYDLMVDPGNSSWLVEPGDNVVITARQSGAGLIFSGKGSEKFTLKYQLDSLQRSVVAPGIRRDRDLITRSVTDYFEWKDFLQKKMDIVLSLLDKYKGKVSDYAFTLIKDGHVNNLVSSLDSKFMALWANRRFSGTTDKNICDIYDTSHTGSLEKWTKYLTHKESFQLSQATHKMYRQASFDSASIPPKKQRNLMSYDEGIKVFKGAMREDFIVNTFPEQLMIEVGFTPEVEERLQQYYAEPGYPEWKEWMREQEITMRERSLNSRTPEFTLIDTKGNSFTKEEFKNKYAVLGFWETGSAASAKMAAILKTAQKTFKNNPDIVFINISVDENKEQWLKSIAQQKYTNGGGIHLYTGGEGIKHDMVKDYAVTTYPWIWVINPRGNTLNSRNPKLDLTKDKGEALIGLLQKQFAVFKDGPYVFHEENGYTSYSIDDKKVSKGNPVNLNVQTDLAGTFPVKLKKSLTTKEPSVYDRPDKLIALSDIEGNFDAFRKLLQNNKIIDEQFNWIFGKGHLVFAGDMFDRGEQVTECLWLMYSLEEKAKAKGGYVHFVLGNHEIMNMKGDHRYVEEKYKNNAVLMGKSLTDLYNENSEIGRWLRTKNVMEKIGDLLFVHGGISHHVWRMPLTLTEMNDLVRPYYAKEIDSTNNNLVILYGSRRVGPEKSYTSPFWFRGYYGDIDNPYEIPSTQQLDSTLQKFNVNRIVTGHTSKGGEIGVYYGGKVINTDTPHAKGYSEALLIEGDKFYRVNAEGKRVLLFIDDKRKQ